MSDFDEPFKKSLTENYEFLVDHLPVKDCLDALFAKGIVLEDERDDLRSMNDRQMAREFVNRLLRKGENTICNFFEILKRKEQLRYLYDRLMGEGQNGEAAAGASAPSSSTSECDSSGLDLNAEVTAKQMMAVAKAARGKWYDIGIQFDIDMNDLDGIQSTKSGDLYKCLLEVLKLWKDSAGKQATVGKLLTVAKKTKVHGAVLNALEDLLKES